MKKTPIIEAIERLDSVCDVFSQLSRAAEQNGWPEDLRAALAKLTRDVELLAGTIDECADDPGALWGLVEQAREALPVAFAALGTALVENLAASRAGEPCAPAPAGSH